MQNKLVLYTKQILSIKINDSVDFYQYRSSTDKINFMKALFKPAQVGKQSGSEAQERYT